MVPESVAYAALAQLPPEFGLYSSFVGGLTYWFCATSKDISIGPISVVSTVVGQVVLRVNSIHPEVEGYVVASLLALSAGIILCILGLLRLGWMIDFVSHTVITAFMTGSAIFVMSTQLTGLLGIRHAKNRGSAFENVLTMFKHIKGVRIDAALGLTALAALYGIKYLALHMQKKRPSQGKVWGFAASLRVAFIISIYTFVSWAVNRHHRHDPVFGIVGTVPRGLRDVKVPVPNGKILSEISGDLPIICILLLMEHIAMSKSFGRINNYQVNPSQEMVGIGVANAFGSFFGAFPATGSFSRTAINAKSGVKTPYGGAVTAALVLIAIYALPAVFFYIPHAPLSAVIIHAVGDLIASPKTIKEFWQISPVDVPLFFIATITAIFYNIEFGTYLAIMFTLLMLLYRSARAKGAFLGAIKVQSSLPDHSLSYSEKSQSASKEIGDDLASEYGQPRHLFLPKEAVNPAINVLQPHPGVFIYRFSSIFTFHNANYYLDQFIDHVLEHTSRTSPLSDKPEDRLWNAASVTKNDPSLPTLKAVIYDFSAVDMVDTTSVQTLVDTKIQLEKYATPGRVQWHFANVLNPWTRRALGAVGFGSDDSSKWNHIYTIVNHDPIFDAQTTVRAVNRHKPKASITVVEEVLDPDVITSESPRRSIIQSQTPAKGRLMVTGLNRPFFHADIEGAMRSVLENLDVLDIEEKEDKLEEQEQAADKNV
jgi:sodium-independent sulfate anion transporter 11